MNILNKLGLQRIPKQYIESNETAEKITKISEKLIDLQKLAIGKIDKINLQLYDVNDHRTYIDDSLADDDLDIVKRILDVSDSGGVCVVPVWNDNGDETIEIITYSTKIPTVKYVVDESMVFLVPNIGRVISIDLVFESPFEEDED